MGFCNSPSLRSDTCRLLRYIQKLEMRLNRFAVSHADQSALQNSFSFCGILVAPLNYVAHQSHSQPTQGLLGMGSKRADPHITPIGNPIISTLEIYTKRERKGNLCDIVSSHPTRKTRIYFPATAHAWNLKPPLTAAARFLKVETTQRSEGRVETFFLQFLHTWNILAPAPPDREHFYVVNFRLSSTLPFFVTGTARTLSTFQDFGFLIYVLGMSKYWEKQTAWYFFTVQFSSQSRWNQVLLCTC